MEHEALEHSAPDSAIRHLPARNHQTLEPSREHVAALAGAALLAVGVAWRGVPGALLGVAGIVTLVRASTLWARRATAKEQASLTREPELDVVDRASLESFPASDPPAYSPARR